MEIINNAEKEFVHKAYGYKYIKRLLRTPYDELDSGHFFNPIRSMIDQGYLLKLLELPVHSVILDMGCGSGWTSCFLSRAGYKVIGVDISENMIEVGRERNNKEGTDVIFYVGDFETFSYENKVDAVIFYDTLHHASNKFSTLKNAYNNLKDGGIIVMIEPNIMHTWKHKKGIDDFGRIEKGLYKYEWNKKLKEAGFKKLESYYVYDRLYKKGIRNFFEMVARLCYQSTPLDITSRIIIRAKK